MDNFSENTTNFDDDNNFQQDNGGEASSFSPETNHNVFALFSQSLGIFSIFCAFFSMFLGTLVCGGLAIILASLSKGYSTKMERNARIGLISGIIGIVLQIGTLGFSLYNIIYVPEYREEFNIIYEQMNGETIDDSIDELLQELGLPEMKGGHL